MTMIALLGALLLSPAGAQTRVELAPAVRPVAAAPAVLAPSVLAPSALGAPALSAAPLAAPIAAPAALPVSAAPVPAAVAPALAAPSFAARVAAFESGVGRAVGALGDASRAAPGDAAAAGRALEDALTGAASAGAGEAAPAATPAELDYAVGASRALADKADDLGAERGLKFKKIAGAGFVALVEDARAGLDAEPAPSPAAAAAARGVRAALVRVVRALVPADRPLMDSLPRALSVWQVFGQEMARAAEGGSLSAVAADARLFAEQVEASVAPAPAAEAAPAAAEPVHPEDPEGYARISEEGSVFGWKPIADSPGHGMPPLDFLIRKALAERRPAHERGFELSGAPRREDARVYFYGERHSDGGLIAENMRRLAADARPGGRLIVLVEGYTGWTLSGWRALEYLADRGLDPEALAAKGVGAAQVEVRGWDTLDDYEASKHPLLEQHMRMLELNRLAHDASLRGRRYYAAFARAVWAAWKGRLALWRAAIVARNADLDRAVARAAADAEKTGATVHAIAGADHLLESPRLSAAGLARPRFRRSLREALGGRPFWAGMPPAGGGSAPR